LGSVIALTNSAGSVVNLYEYSVYGEVSASDPNHPNRFLFTGREFDADTGLYYYRARYYNPYIARFLQTDPAGYGDGMNCYAYCGNSPTNWVDPSGLYHVDLLFWPDCWYDVPNRHTWWFITGSWDLLGLAGYCSLTSEEIIWHTYSSGEDSITIYTFVAGKNDWFEEQREFAKAHNWDSPLNLPTLTPLDNQDLIADVLKLIEDRPTNVSALDVHKAKLAMESAESGLPVHVAPEDMTWGEWAVTQVPDLALGAYTKLPLTLFGATPLGTHDELPTYGEMQYEAAKAVYEAARRGNQWDVFWGDYFRLNPNP